MELLRSPRRIILSLIVVLILGIYWFYLHKAGVPVPPKQQKPIAVPLTKVKEATLPNRVHTLGTIRVQRQFDVYSSVTGEVVSIHVKPKE